MLRNQFGIFGVDVGPLLGQKELRRFTTGRIGCRLTGCRPPRAGISSSPQIRCRAVMKLLTTSLTAGSSAECAPAAKGQGEDRFDRVEARESAGCSHVSEIRVNIEVWQTAE
jgi:hypothetical protein